MDIGETIRKGWRIYIAVLLILFFVGIIMRIGIIHGTIVEIDGDVIAVDDGSDIWEFYGNDYEQDSEVTLLMWKNRVIGAWE